MKNLGLLCAVLLAGCSFDLDGDETRGEEGRSSWQIDDGLCPGFGGCNFEAVLASGATTTIDVEIPGRDPSDFQLTATGPATIGDVLSRDPETERMRVRVTATAPGVATLHLEEIGGAELDRVRLTIGQPADLTCGVVPEGDALLYTMENLLAEQELSLTLPLSGEAAVERQLACRVDDAGGTPLLSVALVGWAVTEGEGVVRVDAEPFETDPNASQGARVSVEPLSAGTATVVARWGELEETFTITVE